MTHKPLLDGSRAKAMFGDMADVALTLTNSLSDALLKQFNGDEKAVIEAVSAALKDSMLLSRVLTLLESGQVDEAEAVLNRKFKDKS